MDNSTLGNHYTIDESEKITSLTYEERRND